MISSSLALAVSMTIAIVSQDNVALRAASHTVASRSATLWRGDWVEVRGEQQGFLKVYDHRHERPGYLRPQEARRVELDEKQADKLLAIVEFLRDQPGSESLGIAYAATYLKVAPAGTIGTMVFDSLGTMADRLARSASARRSALPGMDAAIAGQLEVAESYGVKFARFEGKDATTITCYDGEAFEHVLQMPNASPEEMSRAAMSRTRAGCVDPSLPAIATEPLIDRQLATLERAAKVAPYPSAIAFKLAMRKSQLLASRAFHAARKGDFDKARQATEAAVDSLAAVDRTQLADDESGTYDESATRVATVRWAAELAPQKTRVAISTQPGRAGETCLFVDKEQVACSYGVIWTSSARVESRGRAIAINVTPIDGWNELWLLTPGVTAWQMNVIPPAVTAPDLGYVELAGFAPDGARLMVAKESRQQGRIVRDFQLLRTTGLLVEKEAHTANLLVSFQKFSSVEWRARTLSLRGQPQLARR